VTVMLWDSIAAAFEAMLNWFQASPRSDAIRAIAGSGYETAVIPEERRKYLTRYDPTSAHYEIAATHGL